MEKDGRMIRFALFVAGIQAMTQSAESEAQGNEGLRAGDLPEIANEDAFLMGRDCVREAVWPQPTFTPEEGVRYITGIEYCDLAKGEIIEGDEAPHRSRVMDALRSKIMGLYSIRKGLDDYRLDAGADELEVHLYGDVSLEEAVPGIEIRIPVAAGYHIPVNFSGEPITYIDGLIEMLQFFESTQT